MGQGLAGRGSKSVGGCVSERRQRKQGRGWAPIDDSPTWVRLRCSTSQETPWASSAPRPEGRGGVSLGDRVLAPRRRCYVGTRPAAVCVLLALLIPAQGGASNGCAEAGKGNDQSCVAEAQCAGPTIRSVKAVLGIQGTLTDPAGNLQGISVPGPHKVAAVPAVVDETVRRQRLEVVVGSRLDLNISAAWGWPSAPVCEFSCEGQGDACLSACNDPDNVDEAKWYGNRAYGNYNLSLYAYEDPGVPNGAVLTTQACLGYVQDNWDYPNVAPPPFKSTGYFDGFPLGTTVCNPVRRSFSWEPVKGQEGLVHSMCFSVFVKERPSDCMSDYRCIDIAVMAPDLQWDRSITPADMKIFHSPVGCSLHQCFQAYDDTTLYPVDISPVEGTFAPGATLETECQQLQASSEVYALFPSDTQPPHAVKQGACRKCIRWVAARGMETQVYKMCVSASDTSALRSVTSCIQVEVPKCKYCVQAGDTLHYINKRYNLNSNWLQLWNANGIEEIVPNPLSVATTFSDPDEIHNGNSIINLGPSYEMQQGEDLVAVAKMLRTTVKKLLDINPDIQDATMVKAGTILCAQPCTDAYFATAQV